VTCPLDVIMARRNADRSGRYEAGETVPAPVRRWQEAVHAGKRYDLEIDTSRIAPAETAALILAALGAPRN
jgi:chloramphenicol 3-O phosphotransferase